MLQISPIIREIDSLIEDTGHQYYEILGGDQVVFAVILTREDAEKLVEERRWRISCE